MLLQPVPSPLATSSSITRLAESNASPALVAQSLLSTVLVVTLCRVAIWVGKLPRQPDLQRPAALHDTNHSSGTHRLQRCM